MLLIECPWCGERDQTEFSYGGEAHIARPKNSADISDEAWGDYVFFRSNPKGVHKERWVHSFGCRRWFNMVRDTASGEIHGTYAPGENPPDIGEAAGEDDGAT